MSKYWAAKDTIAKLQMEQQVLQLQLRSLQDHLSLHKLRVSHAQGTEATKRLDTHFENLRVLGERRMALIASHSASVRGPHAREYRTLLAEHIRLQDQHRQVAASRIVARYTLQNLIIDAARSYNNTISPAVSELC